MGDGDFDLGVLRQRLAGVIEARGLTPGGLSKALRDKHGTGQTLVRDILEGYTKSPSFESIKLIADELELPMDYFAGRDAPTAPKAVAVVPSVDELKAAIETMLSYLAPGADATDLDLREAAADFQVWLAGLPDQPPDLRGPGPARASIDLLARRHGPRSVQ